MATMPTFFRRAPKPAAGPGLRVEKDLYRLRPLPQDDVFFYCKKIDNSRLVREPDPKSGGACWSAIGAAAIVLMLLTGVLAPSVASTLAGYKIESLKAEERRLLDERRTLELREAELLSPERLEKLAERQNLVTPKSGQVVRLDGNKPSGAVAMVK
jgi:cell division protein FtsL